MNRQQIREQCRIARRLLSPKDRIRAECLMIEAILTLPCYQTAKTVALYQSFDGEVSLQTLYLDALKQGKQCYFPVMNGDKTLSFFTATEETVFQLNTYAIQEPPREGKIPVALEGLDMVFLPVVAFDGQGTRIGMGQGYYDRTFHHPSHSLLIGVAYELQYQPFIMPEPWDVPLQAVVTEKTIYWNRKS